ncbi:uncharacterized protein LOC132306489 isoform X2 [Cornus florida]|nr:uncharacterized protein LOC132306489 isoform X2 [Cornus florida]
MGGLRICCRQPNAVEAEEALFQSSFLQPFPLSNPDPSSIGEESWAIAEKATQEVLCGIQPTEASEQMRQEIIDYVTRLIRGRLGWKVYPYGSVPLRTYLPDGDIDLTAISSPDVEEALARDVLAVLQGEEQNENAEYEVKDTQFIDAEVKLVKCLVQNIVIDISFNQSGGLQTLCFLEQVDGLARKNHLFKRSIILIKAWCYYESRILGAPHGLISTYALETLILYIFHLFHTSLNGPLAVLYRFLDYFSKFDWENYCVSLNGPVCKSLLPHIVVDMPEYRDDDLMLSEEFIRNCVDMFSVPSRGLEMNLRAFPQKHLNIIDPLRENNNLGRSVHRGNFYRIRSAFKFGARKLGQILLLPRESIADEIKKFFANTLARHGTKYAADVQNLVLTSGTLSTSSDSETSFEDKICLKSSNVDFDNDISGVDDEHTSIFRNELDRYSTKVISSQVVSETGCFTDGIAVLGDCLAGDASVRTATDISDCSLRSSNFSSSFCGQYYYAPPCGFSGSSIGNGKFENWNFFQENISNSVDEEMGSDSSLGHRESDLVAGSTVYDRGSADIDGGLETLNPLLDLTGDYDSHIRSLLYAQCCNGYALSATVLHNPPTSPSEFRSKKPWDTAHQSTSLKQNSFPQMNKNGKVLGQPLYPANNSMRSVAAFGSDENNKPRGTGTFFPNTKGLTCRERPSQGRRKNQTPENQRQFQRHTRSNGFAPTLPETNSAEEGIRGSSNAVSPVLGCGNFGLSHQSRHPMYYNSHANGVSIPSQKLEVGSRGHLAEGSSQLALSTSCALDPSPSLAALGVQSSKPVLGNNQGR